MAIGSRPDYIPGGFYPGEFTNPGAIDAPTIAVKSGTGSGDYSTNSASYVDVDATNLAYSTYVAIGNTLIVIMNSLIYNDNAGGGTNFLGLFDSIPSAIVAATRTSNNGNTASQPYPAVIVWPIVGDNNVHAIKWQFNATAGTNHIVNSSGIVPRMLIFLTKTT